MHADEAKLERGVHTGRHYSLRGSGVLCDIRFGRTAVVGRAQGRTRSTNGRGEQAGTTNNMPYSDNIHLPSENQKQFFFCLLHVF